MSRLVLLLLEGKAWFLSPLDLAFVASYGSDLVFVVMAGILNAFTGETDRAPATVPGQQPIREPAEAGRGAPHAPRGRHPPGSESCTEVWGAMMRRGVLLNLPAVAGVAALTLSSQTANAREENARSVGFTPADALTAEERMRHERYMKRALDKLELDNPERPPGPFAAVIVNRRTDEIVCEGINQYRESPTFHGEIVALNACARVRPKVEWRDLALYTTAEPCPMCMSAIVWTRIPEVIYATSVEELIKLGVNQFRLDSVTVAAAAPFYSGRIVGGVLAERADPIYRRWAARFK